MFQDRRRFVPMISSHLCRIIGEQHGGGNIADNLARKDTDDPLMVRKDRADENP